MPANPVFMRVSAISKLGQNWDFFPNIWDKFAKTTIPMLNFCVFRHQFFHCFSIFPKSGIQNWDKFLAFSSFFERIYPCLKLIPYLNSTHITAKIGHIKQPTGPISAVSSVVKVRNSIGNIKLVISLIIHFAES